MTALPPDPRWVSATDLAEALPVAAAVDALHAAFATPELPAAPQRLVLDVDGAQLISMPAAGEPGAGVKLVSVQPDNAGRGVPLVQSVYVLLSAGALTPVALIDGNELTRIRTAAVSALATKFLARADAGHLVIFGAGVQARAHAEAMRAVRDIERVTVVNRTEAHARALAEELEAHGVVTDVGSADAVEWADVICTCTASPTPVFDGGLVRPGAHVNAVGSFQPHTREVDTRACVRSRIVVEDRKAVLAEAGDLLLPIAEGAIGRDSIVADLRDVVRGARARRSAADITLFKSVGVGYEDLVLAAAAFRRVPTPP